MHVYGFLWYGPLFGEKWMTYVGLDQQSMQNDSMNPMLWVLNTIAIIAPMYALAWLLARLGIRTGMMGAAIAFVIVFCFFHLPLMNANMFAGTPNGLAWITGGYSLTWLTISGFILGMWTKERA
jgi:amino acid permease